MEFILHAGNLTFLTITYIFNVEVPNFEKKDIIYLLYIVFLKVNTERTEGSKYNNIS